MKKNASRKKSTETVSPRKRKGVLCKTMAKKAAKTKTVTTKKQRSPLPPPSLSENNPPMVSLEDCSVTESLTDFEESALLQGTRQRKKVLRKNSRLAKTVRNRSFYDPDEVDFELEDQEFLDDELISLEEFDSILNETKGKTFHEQSIEIDSRKTEACRKDSPHPVNPGRRKKVQRRRQIDPTTCERDYTTDEIEFMRALDEYKRDSGRMFPTCSEILEVLLGLGYTKAVPPVTQEETVVTDPIPVVGETQTLTFTVAVMPSEYHQEYLPFFLNESLSVFEMSTLPDRFSV